MIELTDRQLATVPTSLLWLGLGEYGLALVRERFHAWDDWTPPNLRHLRQAAEARDRQAAEARACLIAEDLSPAMATLANHAVALAMQHNIRVQPIADSDQICGQAVRTIWTPPITSDERYFRFLHEMGHIVDPCPDVRRIQFPVPERQRHIEGAIGVSVAPLEEMAAWRFVIRTALRWTAAGFCECVNCLFSYKVLSTEDELDEMRRFIREAAAAIVGEQVDAVGLALAFGVIDEPPDPLPPDARLV